MFIIYKFYLNNELIINKFKAKNKKNIIKLKIKFELDKDSMKSITKLSTPKNNS